MPPPRATRATVFNVQPRPIALACGAGMVVGWWLDEGRHDARAALYAATTARPRRAPACHTERPRAAP